MLVLLWCTHEPNRCGEVAVLAPRRRESSVVFGRGNADGEDTMTFARQRPGSVVPRGALNNPRLSRRQLVIHLGAGHTVDVENTGKPSLLHNGNMVASAVVEPGDTLEIGGNILLLYTLRSAWIERTEGDEARHPFGEADAYGLVGESPAVWGLRAQISRAARRGGHMLIVGPSGSGKELVARAIHRQSLRASKSLVARNAVTLPDGLIDAELFGNVKNYPNMGMGERPGLIGEADGGTLFLDEIGELAQGGQSHLLRVLDSGEYQRLGDAHVRRANLSVVAATNRNAAELKQDLAARFVSRIEVPGLQARPEDIPLLARYLLRGLAARDPDVRERFFPDGDTTKAPQFTTGLLRMLVRHRYATHARELDALLQRATDASPGQRLRPVEIGEDAQSPPSRRPETVTADEVVRTLARHAGSIEATWRALGLGSRHVLHRLMKKLGVPSQPGE